MRQAVEAGVVHPQCGAVEQARHGKDILNGTAFQNPAGAHPALGRLLRAIAPVNHYVHVPIAHQPAIKVRLAGAVPLLCNTSVKDRAGAAAAIMAIPAQRANGAKANAVAAREYKPFRLQL
jgi:hypothetical protein